jgi:MFS family permease
MSVPNHSTADRRAIFIAPAANLLPSMAVATLGIALPDVRQTLSLSEVEAGSLFSSIFIFAALASPVSGRLSDKIGRKAVLLMGILALSTGFALSSLTPNYTRMLAALGLAGCGYGFTTPSLYALMSDLLPAKRGLATALVSVAYGIGGALGSILASFVIARSGWHAAFMTAGVIGFVIALAEALSVKSSFPGAAQRRHQPYRKALNRGVILLALAEFFGGSVFWSSASWTATVLRSAKELTLQETGFVMAIWGLTPMVGALLLGALSDRYGRKPVILASAYTGAAAAFVVYSWLSTPAALAVGLAVFGTLKATAPTLIVALAQDSAPADSAGAASGVVMSMHYVSAVVAPLIAGRLIASTGDMVLAMILTASAPLIIYGGLIAAVRERQSY